MAMELHYRDMNPDRIRDVPAASISSNYSKVGWNVGSDAAEAGGTDTILVATAHGVAAKDFIIMYTGDEESEPRHAESVTTDLITLGTALSGTPSSGEAFAYVSGTVDAAEASSTTTQINATGHAVSAGDLVWFVDGGETNEPRVVASVNANDFTLNAALSGSPSAGEEFASVTPAHTGAVEAGTTDTIITDADHDAEEGDIFVMTSGGEINEVRVVVSATSTTFTLNEALSGTPTATETYALITPDGTDAVEAGASDSRLIATAHSVAVGDEIIMTSGGEDGEAREVTAVGTDWIDLESALSGAPSATETFNISRPGNYTGSAKIIILDNQLNQDVDISFDGSTDHIWLNASTSMTLDLRANNLQIDREGSIYVKENTTPTTGTLRLTVIK